MKIFLTALLALVCVGDSWAYSQSQASWSDTPSASPNAMDGLSNPPGISFQAKTSAQQPISTPYERYHQKVSNIVGHRWQRYLEEHPAAGGDVTILVLLETSGKVASISVIANHSADDLAALSTRAILESDIPPVPADLVPMLKNGKLKMSFIFNVYDPRKYSPSGQTIQPLQN